MSTEGNCGEKSQRLTEEMKMEKALQTKSDESEFYWLPIEIWDMILRKIEDLQHILTCCDVCVDWNCLLQHKKAYAHHQLILPHLIPYIRTNDILNCSVVSKEWNRWMDTSVVKFKKDKMVWLDGSGRTPILWLWHNENINRLSQFVTQKQEPGNEFHNPLAYRHVRIHYEGDMDDEAFEAFCEHLQVFFKRFGMYIYELEFSSDTYGLVGTVRMISICFTNTPNLKTFKCHFDDDDAVYDDEDIDEVDVYIAEVPLPKSTLKNLEIVDAPSKIVELLIEVYGNQLILLMTLDLFNINFKNMILKGVTCEKLKIFYGGVDGFSPIYDEKLYDFINFLQTLKWPLLQVKVDFIGNIEDFEPFRMEFTEVFKVFSEKHCLMPYKQMLQLRCYTEWE